MSVRRIAGYGLLVLLVVGGLFAYQNRLYLRMAIQQPQLFREPVLDQSAAPLPSDLGAVAIFEFFENQRLSASRQHCCFRKDVGRIGGGQWLANFSYGKWRGVYACKSTAVPPDYFEP